MTAFSPTQPIFRRKQDALDIQDLEGLLRIHFRFKDLVLLSRFYTRVDQVFIVWAAIAVIIFGTAQFLPISWVTQAYIWSVLTVVGSFLTVNLTWYWVSVEQLRWVVYWWVGLMVGGLLLTNWGIFGGGWQILMYLCHLWLGLSAIGYLGTAWGLRSRAFLISSLFHLLGIIGLVYFPQWQYLITGAITAGSLFFFAEAQWDMHSTSAYQRLNEEQLLFNQQQRNERELSAVPVTYRAFE